MQPKHQKHLRGPASDTFDLRQRCNHLVVRHDVERGQRQRSVFDTPAQVADVFHFLAAEANRTQLRVWSCRDLRWRRDAAEERTEPAFAVAQFCLGAANESVL